jgi:hypothetical protein
VSLHGGLLGGGHQPGVSPPQGQPELLLLLMVLVLVVLLLVLLLVLVVLLVLVLMVVVLVLVLLVLVVLLLRCISSRPFSHSVIVGYSGYFWVLLGTLGQPWFQNDLSDTHLSDD